MATPGRAKGGIHEREKGSTGDKVRLEGGSGRTKMKGNKSKTYILISSKTHYNHSPNTNRRAVATTLKAVISPVRQWIRVPLSSAVAFTSSTDPPVPSPSAWMPRIRKLSALSDESWVSLIRHITKPSVLQINLAVEFTGTVWSRGDSTTCAADRMKQHSTKLSIVPRLFTTSGASVSTLCFAQLRKPGKEAKCKCGLHAVWPRVTLVCCSHSVLRLSVHINGYFTFFCAVHNYFSFSLHVAVVNEPDNHMHKTYSV